MGPTRLRLWIGFLVASIARVQVSAMPAESSLLVTSSSKTPVQEPVQETTDPTTEEPNAPIQLSEMQVNSEVSSRYSHTAVVTHVKNPAKKAQEATFRVLLPETAFISGFTMILDGKAYKAYVKEKDEAKQIYNDAVSHGFGAAHIGAKARDSNHFTVSVNVEPNTVAIFNLTYEELLVRRNGVYNHAINLHPGTLVPKLNVRVHIKENEKIVNLRVPEVRSGNEIDATPDTAQNPLAVIERVHDDREAIVTFSPDLDEQKRLMDVYYSKTKESQNSHHNYYFGRNENNEQQEKSGVLGQFVVQYDVERPENGEILVSDGYFVHFYAPSNLPPLNKNVVFVLDTSGSMSGRKIDQLREAMKVILSELNNGDYFSIVEFSNGVLVHNLDEADADVPANSYRHSAAYVSENSEPSLVAPYQATDINVAKAKIIIQRLQANGGTNIHKALDVAMKIVRNSNENEKPNVNTTEVASGKSSDSASSLDPIIIFLTDGDPTVGETDPTRIINRVSEKNFGDWKASIFSLAFGEDADRSFLRKLSLRNDGFMRHIYEAADAPLQLHDFYRQVASPLLAQAHFVYPSDQVKDGSVTKDKFRLIYAGSEAVVTGRLSGAGAELSPEVAAFCGVGGGGRKKIRVAPKLTAVRKSEKFPLERLWAYLTIKQLLDKRDAGEKQDKKDFSKEALDLALKYEFVTPLTSLVVVKPNATKAVDAESVDKENSPPSYASFHLARPMGAAAMGLPGSSLALASPASGPVSLSLDYEAALESESDDFGYSGLQSGGHNGGTSFHSYSARLPSHRFSALQPLFGPPVGSLSGAAGGAAHFGSSHIDSAYPYKNNARQNTAPAKFFGFGSNFNAMDRKISQFSLQAVTTVYSTPSPPSPVPSTTQLPDPLRQWKLESYRWAAPIINSTLEVILVQKTNETVELKLSSADEAPRETKDADCARTHEGTAGLCVYLTRCQLEDTFTAQNYMETFCSVKGFAGVCCPKTKIRIN